VAPERLYAFEESLDIGPTGGSYDLAAETIAQALSVAGTRLAIGESRLELASDPGATSWPVGTFSHGLELYGAVSTGGDIATVRQLLMHVTHPGAAVHVIDSLGERTLLQGEIPLPRLRQMAMCVRMILVRAYDEEGYVVWQPAS
jgi:hypothetical protein